MANVRVCVRVSSAVSVLVCFRAVVGHGVLADHDAHISSVWCECCSLFFAVVSYG
jgi:hypothetical protein